MSRRSVGMPSPGVTSPGISPAALLVFVCGAAAPITLNVVGELYLSEMFLPIAALLIRFSPGGDRSLKERLFARLLLAGLITWLGYVLSDLIQGSRPDQYLRGWGRIWLIMSDFASLAIIFGQDRRNFWWYSLGVGLGSIVFLRVISHAPLAIWKFGYAEPVLLASAALGALLPARACSAWIGVLGLYSMWTDYRSFAAICMVVAALLWLRSARADRSTTGFGSSAKLMAAGTMVLVLVLATLAATGGTESGRRSASDAGRRAAFETGVEAVSRSPIIGYGSWAQDPELSTMYLKRAAELHGDNGSVMDGKQVVFNPHSQILHAWFEGGILGAAFLVVILAQTIRVGAWLVLRRPLDTLTPLMLYFLIVALWNLFMSPFAAPHRLGIATAAALLVVIRMERKQVQIADAQLPYAAAIDRASLDVKGAACARRRRQLVPAQRCLQWKRSTALAHSRPADRERGST